MKLIITRHGETIENQKKIVQGHLPGKLSAQGKEQARKLAARFKGEKIAAIYSSDLARAADTAKEIARFHRGTPVHLVKELRERNFGEWQGKQESEIDWKKIFGGPQPTRYKPKGGESVEEMFLRAKLFLDNILHQHKNQTVLLLGHEGIKKALIAVITQEKPDSIINREVALKNTSVSIYEIDEDKNHQVVCFNCVKHLGKTK